MRNFEKIWEIISNIFVRHTHSYLKLLLMWFYCKPFKRFLGVFCNFDRGKEILRKMFATKIIYDLFWGEHDKHCWFGIRRIVDSLVSASTTDVEKLERRATTQKLFIVLTFIAYFCQVGMKSQKNDKEWPIKHCCKRIIGLSNGKSSFMISFCRHKITKSTGVATKKIIQRLFEWNDNRNDTALGDITNLYI